MPLTQQPDVTVAIMSYNNAGFIGETIESVLAQTGIAMEVIVFDDRSSDNSVAVLQHYTADPRFRFEINPTNLGMMGNYNRCVDAGSGCYIVVLGSDDLIYPGHLASLFAALELHPKSPLAYTQSNWIDENGHFVRQPVHPGHLSHSYFGHRDEVVDLLIHDNYITPSTVMLRRSILNQIRLPDGNVHAPDMVAGDWELWTRIARIAPDFIFLRQATVGYRIHGGQVSQSFYKSDKPLVEHTRILELNLADHAARQRMRKAADRIWELYQCRLASQAPEIRTKFKQRALAIEHALFSLNLDVHAMPSSNNEIDDLIGQSAKRTLSEIPLVSVVVPTHNRPELLVRAIRSIKDQDYKNIEIVVVNDAGTDVEDVISTLRDDTEIIYVRHGKNRGLAAARNTGLNVARGKIITYLDDDDMFLPEHVATIVEALQRQENPFVYTEAEYVVEDSTDGQMKEIGRSRSATDLAYSKERLHICNFIPVNSWGHWKSILSKTGNFDEGLENHEDWDFLLRCSRQFDLTHIPKLTVQVHQRAEADNMLRREQHKFYETFKLLYSRYDDPANPVIARGREQMLQQLHGQTEAVTLTKNDDCSLGTVPFYTTYLTRTSSPFRPDELQPEANPVFEFIIPCAFADRGRLADTVDSLATQSLGQWRLTVLADFLAPDPVWQEFETLRWIYIESGANLADALARHIQIVDTTWLCIVQPSIYFRPDAVEQLARHVSAHPEWKLIYADSDHLSETDGSRCDPLFRPDFNLDLLRSMSYLGDCLWVEREAFLAAGGLGDVQGAQSYDLALRVLDACGESAIGHIDEVLYHAPTGPVPPDETGHKQALQRHLQRSGLSAEVSDGYLPGTWRVQYRHEACPKVSILIPTKNQADLLKACVSSILEKSTYSDYEILIVDNGSTQTEARDYLASLGDKGGRVKVLSYPKPFNFSAMCNLAARESCGEYLLLLNNDTVVLQGDWLERMLGYAQRCDVGIVGAKLMFPDTATVQHAGVVMGLGGIAEHPYLGLLQLSAPGYMNRALVDQDLSAVTGACLMIRRSIWDEVKGLDEQDFRVSYNDIDLCLKVGEKGYKIVWTPHVALLHHGSASQRAEAAHPAKARKAQQRFGNEQRAMLRKWLPRIAHDPAYNRHLSLTHRDYRVESDVVINWNPHLPTEKTRILGWTQVGGSIDYRIKQPLQALWEACAVEHSYIHPPAPGKTRIPLLAEIVRAKPDILTSVAFLELSDYIDTLKELRSLTDIPFVLQMDDLITAIPLRSEAYERRNTPGELKKVLGLADRIVTTTQPIADAIRGYAKDVLVVPNYLPRSVWGGLTSRRRTSDKPRVGWAGAMQHGGDLALIRDVLRATHDEVDWIFFGMCPEDLTPFIKEFHPFVPFSDYPAQLTSLDLDLAVAPLESNRFNECKSNLRLLEYGYLGWPVVCSDVLPYRDAPVKRVPNKPGAWIEAIRERVHDVDAAEREGDALRAWVQENWMLEEHLGEWARAYSFG